MLPLIRVATFAVLLGGAATGATDVVGGVAVVAALGVVSLVINLHFSGDKEERRLREEEVKVISALTASNNALVDAVKLLMPKVRRGK